jgi:hypothetical protein
MRRIKIAVNVIENESVTNVLPYIDFVRARDRSRWRRDPQDGGLFQGRGDPRTAQLIAVSDGSGGVHRQGSTDYFRSVLIFTKDAGENTERNAHAVAHLVGHLLFGPLHDNRDRLSIMNNRTPDDFAFFTTNFDDFTYADGPRARSVRLDRRWNLPR